MNGVEMAVADVFVLGAQFVDGAMQVQYMRKENQGKYVSITEIMDIDTSDEELYDLYVSIQGDLVDLVERGLLLNRNPVVKFGPVGVRERMIAENEAQREEVEFIELEPEWIDQTYVEPER